ncbi:MAG: sulfatase-like hydrolase/transferase, partial [Carboxylicivirga sp.]|nr:sulfatase-like hydrolase/transferase [Carboxylicivirga sp.]
MKKFNLKNWRLALSLFLVAGATVLGGCGAKKGKEAKAKKQPNFLILMSDNHSWNHLGCYGDPVVKTPNIDAIAEKGVKFNN